MRRILRRLYRAVPLKRQVYGLLRDHVTLPHAIYQHLHFEGPFEVRIDDRHRFFMEAYDDALENELFWRGFGGSWEQLSLQIWATLCDAGKDSIIDIGANTGVYSLTACAIAPQTEVIAFEPLARIAKRLRFNASLNKFRIEVAQLGVSDQTGIRTIFDTHGGPNYSASLEEPLANTTSYNIDVTTIDDYVAGSTVKRPIGLVKIDVEKHEPAVIRGMGQIIEADRPTLLIEILNRQIGDEISALVEGRHYRFFRIDEETGLVETRQLGHTGARNWNHLLCTHEKFEAAGLQRFVVAGQA